MPHRNNYFREAARWKTPQGLILATLGDFAKALGLGQEIREHISKVRGSAIGQHVLPVTKDVSSTSLGAARTAAPAVNAPNARS